MSVIWMVMNKCDLPQERNELEVLIAGIVRNELQLWHNLVVA